jgi:hypothetical protein
MEIKREKKKKEKRKKKKEKRNAWTKMSKGSFTMNP